MTLVRGLLLLGGVLTGCGAGTSGLDGGGTLVDGGPFRDVRCADGLYVEQSLPSPTASLEGISLGAGVALAVDRSLERRYPFGGTLVTGGRQSPSFPQDCSVVFSTGVTTLEQLLGRMSVVVHECGHVHDLALSGFGTNAYAVQPGQVVTCEKGAATSARGDTFARSRIRGDAYQRERPVCASGRGCDTYARIYLDGDPDDATFQGGDQGFNMLLEEVVQYVNSLATSYAFQDQVRGQTSARDGILTFLWYLERYLRMARLEYPTAYQRIAGDPCWRRLTLEVWGRAWTYLELTRDLPALGIEDEALEALVSTPELLEEIARLRVADGCK